MEQYEKIWEFSANPLVIEPRRKFKCIFCGGRMERSVGNVFTFKLALHGEPDKPSHAIDTWMRCDKCGYTVVHGVAIPQDKYEEMIGMVRQLPVQQKDGKLKTRDEGDETPEQTGSMIIPIEVDKMKKKKKKYKPQWEETHDEQGLSPLFKIKCKFCGYKGDMFLRHSRLHVIKRGEVEVTHGFRISYKCPICDWLATFVVPIRKEYAERTLDLRNGEPLYYPPLEKWGEQADDDLITKKLEDLGYA